jgi:hypothetical protein
MTTFYESGISQPVSGAARSFDDVTLAEMLRFPPSPARPTWMTTRFPVSIEEYNALKLAAQQPGQAFAPSLAAAAQGITIDVAQDVSHISLEAPEGETWPTAAPGGAAGAAPPGAALPTAPTTDASFDGIPHTAWQPPDNTIAVGPNDVLVAVNTDLAGYSKTGALKFRWANMTALFNPVLPAGASPFDPRVGYDHYAGRWIVVVGARRQSPAGSWLLVAVSQGADPGGAYWIWALDATLDGSTPTQNWADYPMLGFDTQAIYISMNMFPLSSTGSQYAKLRILNKAELYAGGAGAGHIIRWQDFWNLKNPDNSTAFAVQPAVHFRGLGGNPNAYLVNALWPSGSTLTLWTLSNPLGIWTGGSASLSRAAVTCRSYALPPHAEQPGTATRVDTGDTRLLNAVYQNAAGVQRLWTAQTSKFTWTGEAVARAALQWTEIDVPTLTAVQQGAFGAAGSYYFYPAILPDAARNGFVVCSRSSATVYAEMRQTGRLVGDPPSTLQGSALVQAGASAYLGGRWGDYHGICRDGADGSRVWMYGEYAGTGGTWGTHICRTHF